MGHDLGLSLIYGPVLGAWLFPFSYSVSRLINVKPGVATFTAISIAILTSLAFISALIKLDSLDKEFYDQAAKRNGFS